MISVIGSGSWSQVFDKFWTRFKWTTRWTRHLKGDRSESRRSMTTRTLSVPLGAWNFCASWQGVRRRCPVHHTKTGQKSLWSNHHLKLVLISCMLLNHILSLKQLSWRNRCSIHLLVSVISFAYLPSVQFNSVLSTRPITHSFARCSLWPATSLSHKFNS